MSDWNQFRGDARHSGVRRDVATATRPEETWGADLAASVSCDPVCDRGAVYVGTERGYLYSFDLEGGRRRWVFEAGTGVVTTPVVTRERAFVGTDDGTVHALDQQTGERVWTHDAAPPLAPGLTGLQGRDGDAAIVVADDDGVTLLEGATGEVRWHHETETAATAGTPACDDDRVYAGTAYGSVVALERATGEEVWTAPTDGAVVGGPTVVDDRVYVADDDGTLVAMDAESGQSWFTYEIRDAFVTAPTVLEDALFVGAADGVLHVTDTTFGNRKLQGLLFSKKGLALDGVPRTEPVVAGGTLCIVDSRGTLYGVDLDELDFDWNVPLEAAPASAPALVDGDVADGGIAGGGLVVGTADERLVRLDWR